MLGGDQHQGYSPNYLDLISYFPNCKENSIKIFFLSLKGLIVGIYRLQEYLT